MDFRSLRARRASLLVGGVAALVFSSSLTSPLAAQSFYDGETLVIGGGAAPRGSVTVDMGALDAIDGFSPPAAMPSRPGGRIVLTPPGASAPARPAAARPATAAPAPVRPAPAPAPTVAAKPAPAPTPAPTTSRPAPAPVPTTSRPAPAPTPAPAAPEVRPLADQAAPPPAPIPAPVAAAPAPPAAPAPVAAPPIPAPVAAAEPRPAPVATPAPRVETPPAPRQQTAAVTPVPQPPAMPGGESQALRIGFSGESATLPDPAKGDLKGVIDSMAKNPAMRVQVKAYASGTAEAASKARRISLSRALAVRSYLIEQGIGSTRIDVRALGNNAEGGPGDRVDLVLVAR